MLLISVHICTLTTQDAIYHSRKRVELTSTRFSSNYKLVKVIRDNTLTAPKDSSLGLIRIGNGGNCIIINNIN